MRFGDSSEQASSQLGSKSEHSRCKRLTALLQLLFAQTIDQTDDQDPADDEGQQENGEYERGCRRPPNPQHSRILHRKAGGKLMG